MPNYICRTCGVQFSESDTPPPDCPICLDPRQYVGWEGQQWTTMDGLIGDGYRNELRSEESRLLGIGITPSFSIGQRALLVQTPGGNVLYDCVSLLDESATAEIRGLGGIDYICFSHPHFYDSMVEFSSAFDDAVIVVPEADREHVMRPAESVRYWDGQPLELVPGVTLIQCGRPLRRQLRASLAGWRGRGRRAAGWRQHHGRPDRRYVSFMTSYPNLIPMSAAKVRGIVDAIAPYRFDRIYGGWWGRNVVTGAQDAVRRSAARYVEHISDSA